MHDILKLFVILVPLLSLYLLLRALSKWSAKRDAKKAEERRAVALKAMAETYAEVNRKPLNLVGTGPAQVAAAKKEIDRNIQKVQAQKRAVRERESSRGREFETDDIQNAAVIDLFRRNDPPPEPSYVSPPSFESTSHDTSTSHESSHSSYSHDSHSSHDSFSSSHDSGSFGGGDSGGGSSGGEW